MRHTTVPAVLLAGFMVSCATAKVDTRKPLDIDSSGFSTTYRQGGQLLVMNDLEEALEAHPVAGSKMSGYASKKWAGMLLGYAGGGLVGWNLGNNLTRSGDKDWTLSLVGAGIVAVAMPFGIMADRQLRSAAEVYNGSFTQQTQSTAAPTGAVPFVSFMPAPSGGNRCMAGFTMVF